VPLLLLLVPDGSLPSPRWRPVAWIPAAAIALVSLGGALTPGPLGSDPRPGTPQNPVGIEPARQVLEVAVGVGFLVIPVVAVVALVALALRFRRSQGMERQQLKWFAYGAFLLIAGLAALWAPIRSEAVAKAIFAVGVGCFTVGVAVAVLRYGMYEIDVIVNRTLVYGLLPSCSGWAMAAPCSSLGSWPVGSGPALWWPALPWPWRRRSSRPGAGSRRRWTGASTAASTTRPRRSRGSAPACATRLTWTRCRPRC
jgi:hypothetical protein